MKIKTLFIHALYSCILLLGSTQASAVNLIQLFAGLLGEPIFEESDLYDVNDDIVITSFDGSQLQANIFVPTTGASSYPAIVFINSWGMNEYEYLPEAARFANEGYVVLSYATRGFGGSDGQIATAGPEDIADLAAAIAYLKTNHNISKVGVSGISYGSGISLIGAALIDDVDAVVAMSTWGSLADSLYGQQTPRLIWGGLLTGLGYLTGNPDPEIAENYTDLLHHQRIAEILDWAAIRSPKTYLDLINEKQVPIYMANNFGDNLFQPNSVLKFYQQLTGPKRLDLSQGTHAITEVLQMGDEDSYLWGNAHLWFDRYLKNQSNGVELLPSVGLEVKFSHWDMLSQWPNNQINNQTFYLHEKEWDGDGDMKTSPYRPWWPKTDTVYGGFDTLATSGIPILSYLTEGLIDAPILSSMPLISTTRAIRWESDWLDSTMKIRGMPSIKLNVTPNESNALMVAYLYDVDWAGVGRLITHAPITLKDVTPGSAMDVNIEMTATAYDVPKNHYVALVIDTVDALYSPPALGTYKIKVNYARGLNNTLNIPTK